MVLHDRLLKQKEYSEITTYEDEDTSWNESWLPVIDSRI